MWDYLTISCKSFSFSYQISCKLTSPSSILVMVLNVKYISRVEPSCLWIWFHHNVAFKFTSGTVLVSAEMRLETFHYNTSKKPEVSLWLHAKSGQTKTVSSVTVNDNTHVYSINHNSKQCYCLQVSVGRNMNTQCWMLIEIWTQLQTKQVQSIDCDVLAKTIKTCPNCLYYSVIWSVSIQIT